MLRRMLQGSGGLGGSPGDTASEGVEAGADGAVVDGEGAGVAGEEEEVGTGGEAEEAVSAEAGSVYTNIVL